MRSANTSITSGLCLWTCSRGTGLTTRCVWGGMGRGGVCGVMERKPRSLITKQKWTYLLRPGRQGLRCVSSSNANLLQIFYGPSVSIDHCLMINECVCMHLDCGRNICRGLLPVGTEHPVQITSAYSVCECVWGGHRSLWQPGSCLLNDVGFIYEVMADVWEGGEKSQMGRDWDSPRMWH